MLVETAKKEIAVLSIDSSPEGMGKSSGAGVMAIPEDLRKKAENRINKLFPRNKLVKEGGSKSSSSGQGVLSTIKEGSNTAGYTYWMDPSKMCCMRATKTGLQEASVQLMAGSDGFVVAVFADKSTYKTSCPNMALSASKVPAGSVYKKPAGRQAEDDDEEEGGEAEMPHCSSAHVCANFSFYILHC